MGTTGYVTVTIHAQRDRSSDAGIMTQKVVEAVNKAMDCVEGQRCYVHLGIQVRDNAEGWYDPTTVPGVQVDKKENP